MSYFSGNAELLDEADWDNSVLDFIQSGYSSDDDNGDESHYNSHPQSGYVSDFVSSWEKGFVS